MLQSMKKWIKKWMKKWQLFLLVLWWAQSFADQATHHYLMGITDSTYKKTNAASDMTDVKYLSHLEQDWALFFNVNDYTISSCECDFYLDVCLQATNSFAGLIIRRLFKYFVPKCLVIREPPPFCKDNPAYCRISRIADDLFQIFPNSIATNDSIIAIETIEEANDLIENHGRPTQSPVERNILATWDNFHHRAAVQHYQRNVPTSTNYNHWPAHSPLT